jgi:magnesium chelatase accessory protein
MHSDLPGCAFVPAGGLRWRLRRAGTGPRLLLIHGTGSSLRSWDGVWPALSARFEVLAPDLPGHGDTGGWADHRASLPRMAAALTDLLQAVEGPPHLIVGHSAGAAVMLQVAMGTRLAPAGLMALNGALQPLGGVASAGLRPLARLLSQQAWLPALMARRASQPQGLSRLIASTGSRLDAAATAHYRELLTRPAHVRGALDMMGHWRLESLLEALPRLRTPLWLVAASNDRTVPAAQSRRLAERLPRARFVALPGLGHLAHEEDPAQVVALIDALAAACGVRDDGEVGDAVQRAATAA